MARQHLWMTIITANSIWLAIFSFGFVMIWLFGTDIETSIAPVVRVESADHTFRDEYKFCWSIWMKKLRPGIPQKYEFFAETKLSALIPLSAYLANPDNSRKADSDLTTHPVGAKWMRRYCAEIPQTIADAQEVRISGDAQHIKLFWNRPVWWTSRSVIPPFNIAPLDPI